MTHEEAKTRLAELITEMRSVIAHIQWDSMSDWSRRVRLTDQVELVDSPGDFATAFTVTIAHQGVKTLADEPESIPSWSGDKVTATSERQPLTGKVPSEQRDIVRRRIERFLDGLKHFTGWHEERQLDGPGWLQKVQDAKLSPVMTFSLLSGRNGEAEWRITLNSVNGSPA